MFSIFEASNNKLQLSILETLPITKLKPELCVQKQFYTILFISLF